MLKAIKYHAPAESPWTDTRFRHRRRDALHWLGNGIEETLDPNSKLDSKILHKGFKNLWVYMYKLLEGCYMRVPSRKYADMLDKVLLRYVCPMCVS